MEFKKEAGIWYEGEGDDDDEVAGVKRRSSFFSSRRASQMRRSSGLEIDAKVKLGSGFAEEEAIGEDEAAAKDMLDKRRWLMGLVKVVGVFVVVGKMWARNSRSDFIDIAVKARAWPLPIRGTKAP